jgi:hypothetical protein
MVEVELSLERLFKIWWSLLWRGLLFGGLTGFVIGFIIGFVGAIAHIDKTITMPLIIILSALTGIPIGIWVIKNIIKKRYSDFRIALVSDNAPI